MKISKKAGMFGFGFNSGQQGDAIESAAEKPSCPAFFGWHSVWLAQVGAQEHKLHSQLHTWSHGKRGRVEWTWPKPGPISLWLEAYANSFDPAENSNVLVRALNSINQPNSPDFNRSVKLMDARCGLGPNRWILSSVQAFIKKGEFTCCFSFIFGVYSTDFAQLLQKANRAPMSWCLNQKLQQAWPQARADTPVSAMLQAGQQLCWRAEVARDKGWDEEGVIRQPHWRVLPLPSPAIQTEHITTADYLQFNPCHILQRQWNGGAFHRALSWGGSRRTSPPSGPWVSWGQWEDGVLAGKGRGEEGTSKDGRSAQVTWYIYKCTQYQPWMTSTGLVEQLELEDMSCNDCNK